MPLFGEMGDTMNESVDRELGKLSQQIENTATNLSDVKKTLYRLFDTVDEDSKDIIKEISKYEVQQEEQSKRLDELKELAGQNKKDVSKEREERLTFETETKTGIKFTKYTAVVLGSLATILSALAAVLAFLN